MTTDLRPFSEWITDHARGTVDDEMTMAIAEVTEAVAHHDKPGTACRREGHDWTDPRNVRTRPNGRRYCAECDRIAHRAKRSAV